LAVRIHAGHRPPEYRFHNASALNSVFNLAFLLAFGWVYCGIAKVPAKFMASAELHWHQTPDGFYNFNFSAVENSTNSVCLVLKGSMKGVPSIESLVDVAKTEGVRNLEAKIFRRDSIQTLDRKARVWAEVPSFRAISMESKAEHAKRMTETMLDGVAAQKRELDFMMDLALKEKSISDIYYLSKKSQQIQDGMKNLASQKPCIIQAQAGKWDTIFSVTPRFDNKGILAAYTEKTARSRGETNQFLRAIEFNTEILIAVPFHELPAASGKLLKAIASEDMHIIGIQLDFETPEPTVRGVHTHSEAFTKGVRPGLVVASVGGGAIDEDNFNENAQGDKVVIELRDEQGGLEVLTLEKMKIKKGETLHWLSNPF